MAQTADRDDDEGVVFPVARDGGVHALGVALKHPRGRLHTHTVAGIGKVGPAPVAVPYRGQVLTGDVLRRQVDRWVVGGLVEPSFAQALWRVQAHPEWVDLSDQRFALPGAYAQMGPLPYLLRWRSTVYAVDLPRAASAPRLSSRRPPPR